MMRHHNAEGKKITYLGSVHSSSSQQEIHYSIYLDVISKSMQFDMSWRTLITWHGHMKLAYGILLHLYDALNLEILL